MLKIYADFNSGTGDLDNPFWCLRYGNDLASLDLFEQSLSLEDGLLVTIYYEDQSEKIERLARLKIIEDSPVKWGAVLE